MSVTILVPQQWSFRHILESFRHPGRATGKLPAPYVDELMSRRFGCVLICPSCEWKYREGVKRHGYRRVPDVHAKGGACDFCKTQGVLTQAWSAEEKMRGIFLTREDRTAERKRELAPFPQSFRDIPRTNTRRVLLCKQ